MSEEAVPGGSTSGLPTIKVTLDPVEIEILSEPSVLLTFRGYAPVVHARKLGDPAEHVLFIGAASLGRGVEPLRKANGGKFTGLKLRLWKQSADAKAAYEVKGLN